MDVPEISDAEIDALIERAGATRDRALLRDIVRSALGLAADEADRLDLKITAAALAEMREAFRAFAPYKDQPKVSIFGSARTQPDDPLYAQARDVARELARQGWMVITGAGPGIMAAGLEGAGREQAFGVTIRLPFEESVNEFIAGDVKLVSMKYFFTRKLMLIKESDGFIALPGGFGTQDETFELFTLQQTGKGHPAPVVLLDTPGGTYWRAWAEFVRTELAGNGLIAETDQRLYLVTDDIEEACAEIVRFYRNYHSIRWVGDQLVIRLRFRPTDDDVASLNEQFGDLCLDGRIVRSGPLGPEQRSKDHLELHRIVLRFEMRRIGSLRLLIDALNRLPSLPHEA